MDTARVSLSRKLMDDFFKDVVPIAAFDIAKAVAESRGFRGQEFDEEIRWNIQREMEAFLDDNQEIRTSVFDQNHRDRGRAVNVLMSLYEKFIASAVPNTEVLVDRSV